MKDAMPPNPTQPHPWQPTPEQTYALQLIHHADPPLSPSQVRALEDQVRAGTISVGQVGSRVAMIQAGGSWGGPGGGGGAAVSGDPVAPAPPPAPPRNLHAELARENPWMPAPIIDLWNHLIVVEGLSENEALARVRASDVYEQHFPGNRRPDGSVREKEEEFMAKWEGHSLRLQSYGLNPEAFREQIAALIEFGVSPAEFDNRLQMVQNGIIDRVPAVRAWYAANYGIDVSDEQIFASLIDPSHADAIIQGRLDVSLIGGSAAAFGFTRSIADVERITATPGFNPESAYGFYAGAGEQVSRFDAFARRYGDLDPDVDIAELEEAALMGDPVQRARLARLAAQERSLFSQGAAFREDRERGVIGLRAR